MFEDKESCFKPPLELEIFISKNDKNQKSKQHFFHHISIVLYLHLHLILYTIMNEVGFNAFHFEIMYRCLAWETTTRNFL